MHAPPPDPADAVRPTGGDDAALVAAFTDILVGPRTKGTPPLLESILDKAVPHRGPAPPEADAVLTDLFGFDPARMPRIHHRFCSELGLLCQQLVACAFRLTRGPCLRQNAEVNGPAKARYLETPITIPVRGHPDRQVKWKDPDFEFDRTTLVEVKYRFNSKQTKIDQIEVAQAYRRIGYEPIWLHISPDCRQIDDFLASCWEVRVGSEAIAWIEEHTGVDFRGILRRVAAQPAIAARLAQGHARILERWSAEALRDIDSAPERVRDDIYEHIAVNDRHRRAVLRRVTDPLAGAEFDRLRDTARDTARGRIDAPPGTDDADHEILVALLDRMKNDKKVEALRTILDDLPERQIDEVLSTHG